MFPYFIVRYFCYLTKAIAELPSIQFPDTQETPETTSFASNAVAGRLGKIRDIVPLVEFLALPSSQWITGQTIWINGGYLTR